MDFTLKDSYGIGDLLAITALLRSENGCPWDREQSHQSIRNNFLEEAYEAVEAIDKADDEMLKEELGDVLFQVVFHSRIAQEEGGFAFEDVCDRVCQKLILRHPHVFGDVTVRDSTEVLGNWDRIKKEEKGQTSAADTLKSVPEVFPALMRASKVQSRAGRAGFEINWSKNGFRACNRLLNDLQCQSKESVGSDISLRLGELLFLIVSIARGLGIDSEESLQRFCERFIEDFGKLEEAGRVKESDIELLADLRDKE